MFHCGLLSYSNLSSHNIVNPVGSAATWLNKYLRKPLFICTMHSVPQLKDKGVEDARNCYEAINQLSKKYDDIGFIITSPNPDEGYVTICKELNNLDSRPNLLIERSLGKNYYFLLNTANKRKLTLMGNSSSIIKEAPYFNCYHINIGQRQMEG